MENNISDDVRSKIEKEYPTITYNYIGMFAKNYGNIAKQHAALKCYSIAQEELKKAIEENEKLHKCVDMFHEIVYQYIQWVTSNTEKQPDFIKCHEALDYCNTIYPIKPND